MGIVPFPWQALSRMHMRLTALRRVRYRLLVASLRGAILDDLITRCPHGTDATTGHEDRPRRPATKTGHDDRPARSVPRRGVTRLEAISEDQLLLGLLVDEHPLLVVGASLLSEHQQGVVGG